jgi:DNA-binding beta-propeller fold protein YncE
MNVRRNIWAMVSAAWVLWFLSFAHAASPAFEHVMNIGSAGKGEGQFQYVEDLAFTNDGRLLLVTDSAHAWVQVYDKASGKFITRFGGKGKNDSNLEKPQGISVAPDGRIFIADYTTGYVKIYDQHYTWVKTFSGYGSEPGQNIKSVFTDIHEGKYFMPEAGNHRISVWDLQGNFLYKFSEQGSEPGKLHYPKAAKFNSKGEMVVADLKNDRIQVFNPKGELLRVIGKTGSGAGELKAPAGIGFDEDDNIYVGEVGNDRISVFDSSGKFLTSFGKSGRGDDGRFCNVHGVVIDKSTGWIYIADTNNNRVQVYKPK